MRTRESALVPHDGGLPGQLQAVPCGEVQELNASSRVLDHVAQGLEQAVADKVWNQQCSIFRRLHHSPILQICSIQAWPRTQQAIRPFKVLGHKSSDEESHGPFQYINNHPGVVLVSTGTCAFGADSITQSIKTMKLIQNSRRDTHASDKYAQIKRQGHLDKPWRAAPVVAVTAIHTVRALLDPKEAGCQKQRVGSAHT